MPKKYGVFISYSHDDREFVSPIVQLIKTMRKDLVFQDTKDLKPGKLWEIQILNALNEAEIVIVFWCQHAADSAYVKKEYELAIVNKKDVLPLLLDDTTVIAALAAYQWIDLRNIVFHKNIDITVGHNPNYDRTDNNGNLIDGEDQWTNDGLTEVNENAKSIASIIFNKLNEKIPPISL